MAGRLGRNRWTECSGIDGRLAPESVDGMHRNRWTACAGIRSCGERLLLSAGGLLAAGMAVGALIRTGLWTSASPFVFAPLSIGALALLHGLAKAVRVWGAGESAAVRIRMGSGLLLRAAAGALFATAFGVLYEMAAAAAAIELAPAREGELLVAWLRRSVLLGVLGISVSLLSGLGWLLFMHRAAVVEKREQALLGPPLRLPGLSQYLSRAGGS